MTTSTHRPPLWKRITALRSSPSRKPAVETVGGVQMSCQELNADFAVIRFACPPAAAPSRKRVARRPTRQT